MNIKKIFEFKNILFLLLISIVLNIIGFLLVLRIDSLVHIELYNYGLIFNNEWAKDYWFFKDLLLTFLSSSIIISILSLIPHYDHNKHPTNFSKWAGILLPLTGIVYEMISIIFLMQLDRIVRNDLYQFGLFSNFNWSAEYGPLTLATLTMMIIAIVVLIIPMIRTAIKQQNTKTKKISKKKKTKK